MEFKLLGTLHSTMFLLKLSEIPCLQPPVYSFTFHNVSIKTPLADACMDSVENFTFHNVSIKTIRKIYTILSQYPLHSTMFLLKQI